MIGPKASLGTSSRATIGRRRRLERAHLVSKVQRVGKKGLANRPLIRELLRLCVGSLSSPDRPLQVPPILLPACQPSQLAPTHLGWARGLHWSPGGPPSPPWCPWTPPARRPWLVRSHPSIVPSPFWRQSIASDPHPSAASFVCLAHSRRMAWAPSFRVSVAPSPICPVAAQRWPAWAAAWPDKHEYSHSAECARVLGRSPLHFPVHCAVSRTWLKYGASVPARREVLCSEHRSGVIRGRHELLGTYRP